MLILSQRRPSAFEAGADFFPVGIEGGEKRIEFAVVSTNVEVGEFVSDNVLQGFFVMFGELKVKRDGACFDVAGSPTAFHATYFIP